MNEKMDLLRERLSEEDYQKLVAIDNHEVHKFVARYIELCNPEDVFICTDSPEDLQYIRDSAIKEGEEIDLAMKGHTVHFDGYYDQARDKEHTKFLVLEGVDLGPNLNQMDKEDGLKEIRSIMENIMEGHTLYVRFFCLGPVKSKFTVPCVQLTDSSYVAHSEDLLYRQGYEEFKRLGRNAKFFFKFVHSEGELDERNNSQNIDKRRVYIDTEDEIVYSANTQYGGNTIGLKKLAMRLGIHRGAQEGWLTEHMLVMAIHGPEGRKTYFTGAFPSMCGKTSTAMLDNESIVGDDIAYLRKIQSDVRAVNVEEGIFGIIQGINSKDDPIQWNALHTPGEIIFSNVLITEDKGVHWIGKDGEVPEKGYNHSGEWWKGKTDEEGKEIPCSHPNARFTINLKRLENVDAKLNDPKGVKVGGIVYGGRDSDTWVPVEEAFSWEHGVITKGASLESETTAATLGKEGIRVFNPMSNLDFLSVPIGKYIEINLNFGKDVEIPPQIFSVNYFLQDENGKYLNAKVDKKVWYKWMELRVHDDVGAITTPTGKIPKYEDLKPLFKEVLDKEYTKEEYVQQFTIRIPENLAKIERIREIYKTEVANTPREVFEQLKEQEKRLKRAKKEYGNYISPFDLEK